MTDRLTCGTVDERDLVARFVGGSLPEAEAEALERHCLACERCWSELRLASRVHAAAAAEPVAATSAPPAAGSAPVLLRWGGLAAAIVIAAAAVHLLTRPGQEADVERGAGSRLTVTVERSEPGVIELDWNAIEGAARYTIEVIDAEGGTTLTRDVVATEARIEVPRDPGAAGALTVSVIAYDALGTRLAESPLAAVP